MSELLGKVAFVTVANAGIARGGPVLELSLKDWQDQLDVNLTGVFLTVQATAWSISWPELMVPLCPVAMSLWMVVCVIPVPVGSLTIPLWRNASRSGRTRKFGARNNRHYSMRDAVDVLRGE